MTELGVVVWFTGRPSSGKSTLARATQARGREYGLQVCLLDGDELRAALVPTPGYSAAERSDFYATLRGLAELLAKQGVVTLVAATAARRAFRDEARAKLPRFIEVFVDVPLEECARRDTKGLYALASAGRVKEVPGVDLPYEPPLSPELIARGGQDETALAALLELIRAKMPEQE